MHVDEEDLGQDLRQDRILAKARRRFVFELKRIIDDDFRGRYLERELVLTPFGSNGSALETPHKSRSKGT